MKKEKPKDDKYKTHDGKRSPFSIRERVIIDFICFLFLSQKHPLQTFKLFQI